MVHCFLRLSRHLCALLLLAFAATLPAHPCPQKSAPPAAPARLWGKLTPGPHRVGFKAIFAFDPSRTWKTTRSYQKPFSPDPAGRPVRIEVWYPAQPGAQAKPMNFGDYVHISAPDAFSDIELILEARDTELAGFSVAHGKLDALLATTVYAWRDAAPKPGPFPLILYFPGLNDATTAPSVPAEYLASHGYVVAEVALLGTSPQDPNQHRTQFGIETSLRDMEFAWGLLRREPYINSAKTGAIGHSLGSIEAVLLAMRNTMITAVVGLDGTYGFGGDATKALTGYFTYSPQRMFAALLDLRRPAQGFTLDLSALHSFHYSDRTFITVEEMHHSDFGSFAAIAQEFDLGNSPGYVDPFQWTRATGFEGFQNVFRMVRDFFDGKLKEAPDAPQRLQADLQQAQGGTFKHIDALEPPPSPEELATLARHDGFEAATSVIERYRAVAPVQWIIDASAFNSYGYGRMAARQFADSITAFRLNTFAYPNSANLLDSLGDGYAAAGDKANAIVSYQRALELVNNDPEFDAEGRKQFANEERTKIQQLGGGVDAHSPTGPAERDTAGQNARPRISPEYSQPDRSLDWIAKYSYDANSVLPFEIGKDGIWVPIVTARLAGREVRFIFDTGANGYADLDQKLIADFQLPITGWSNWLDSSGKSSERIPVARASSLEFGPIHLKDVEVTGAGPESITGTRRGFAGSLGWHAFQDLRVTLDYSNKKIAFSKSALPAKIQSCASRYVTHFVSPPAIDGLLLIDGELDGQRFYIEVDTGKSSTELDPKITTIRQFPQGSRGYMVEGIKIGPFIVKTNFGRMSSGFAGFDQGLNKTVNLGLGTDVLDKFLLTIDYPNRVLVLEERPCNAH